MKNLWPSGFWSHKRPQLCGDRHEGGGPDPRQTLGFRQADHLRNGMPAQPPGRLTLATLVVTYNRLDKLCVTVNRLLAEDMNRVLVFDNQSGGSTDKWLASLSNPRLIVIRSPEKIGGAGAFHEGGGIWWNSSIPMGSGSWTMTAALSLDASAYSATCLRMTGMPWAPPSCPLGRGVQDEPPLSQPVMAPGPVSAHAVRRRAAWFSSAGCRSRGGGPSVAIDMATFVGLFLSRNAIRAAGYPDERLFIYGDNQLYTLTLRRPGGDRVSALDPVRT